MPVKLTVASYYDPTGINAALTALKTFERRYDITSSNINKQASSLAWDGLQFQQYGMKISNAGKELDSIGTVATKVAVPIAALGTAAITAATEMESNFAYVRKTVNATEEEYQKLYDEAIQLSTVHAVSAADVATLQGLSAQLGVAKENISKFAEIAYSLDLATDLDAETAITELAQFVNITQLAESDADRLAATVVALGNTSATTESVILDMGLRIAAAGKQAGLTDANTMALASTLASLGMKAEVGGTAMSKTLQEITRSVATADENLAIWADLAGMSVEKFTEEWQKGGDVTTETFAKIVKGMTELSDETEGGALVVLDELGITAIRQSDALLRFASSGDLLTESIKTANEAFEENTAMTREVANRESTLASQWQILKNRATEAAITLGGPVIESLKDCIDAAEPALETISQFAKSFANMDSESQKSILKFSALAVAIGPAAKAVGSLTNEYGKLVTSYGKVIGKQSAATAKIKLYGDELNKLKSESAEYVSRTGDAAGAASKFGANIDKTNKKLKESKRQLVASKAQMVAFKAAVASTAATLMVSGIKAVRSFSEASSEANASFNSALSSSSGWATMLSSVSVAALDEANSIGESGRTVEQLNDAIAGYESATTEILATAISERRQLREDEVNAIRENNAAIAAAEEEKFNVYAAALDSYSAIVKADGEITIDESAKYLATAQAKYDEAASIASDAYEEQVQIVHDYYEAIGKVGSAEYAAEIDALKETYDARIETLSGSLDTIENMIAESSHAMVESQAAAWDEIAEQTEGLEIKQGQFVRKAQGWWVELIGANTDYKNNYKSMLAEMDYDTTAAFLSMQSTIVDNGGVMTDESIALANSILDSFDNLPDGFNDIAHQALEQMVSGMEDQWPWAANAATMTADEIVDALRKELALQDTYSAGYDEGENASKGYAEGATSTESKSWIARAAQKVVSWFKGGIESAQDSHSPAKLFMEDGENASLGYAEGVASSNALSAVSYAAQKAVVAAREGYASASVGGGLSALQTPYSAYGGTVINGGISVTITADDAQQADSVLDLIRREAEAKARFERMA